MRAALLTAASSMICPHGGAIAGEAGTTLVRSGAPVLRVRDTFVITGCTYTISDHPSPCVRVHWVVGTSRVRADGTLVLNDASVGLCLGPDGEAQGMVLVVDAQSRVFAL